LRAHACITPVHVPARATARASRARARPRPFGNLPRKTSPRLRAVELIRGVATRLFFLVFSWTRLTRRSHPVLLPPTRQVKLNTDESPSVATEYGIRSIPTVMIFKGGQKLDTVIGAVPKSTLTGTIEKYL
jgi:hypothetical protein